MCLAQVRQNEQHKGPDADKERDDEQQNLPLWNRHIPEETPVSTIRLGPELAPTTCENNMKFAPHLANSPEELQMQGTLGVT